jgi:hypothetical protein
MFKFASDTAVSGFRVGLPDELPGFSVDENGSVRRPLPAAPVTTAFGYDPYGNVLQTMAPTAFGPAGMLPRANDEFIPAQYHPYAPVSGGRPSRIRCDKPWIEPVPQSTEGRRPRIHCDKQWIERPTLASIQTDRRSRTSG